MVDFLGRVVEGYAMTHHEINEAIGRSLGWRTFDVSMDGNSPWMVPVKPGSRITRPQPLPDFAASQDALDRWVQPEVERRGWQVCVWASERGAWSLVYPASGMAIGDKHAPTAAIARCLAWLEAVAATEGSDG